MFLELKKSLNREDRNKEYELSDLPFLLANRSKSLNEITNLESLFIEKKRLERKRENNLQSKHFLKYIDIDISKNEEEIGKVLEIISKVNAHRPLDRKIIFFLSNPKNVEYIYIHYSNYYLEKPE